MSGILWENDPTPFIVITLLLGGGAAWMSGRGVAQSWSSPLLLLGYAFLLACAARFLHFALGGGSLIAPQFFLVDFLCLLALAGLGFRVARASQMATQYFWLYERTSPISWRARAKE